MPQTVRLAHDASILTGEVEDDRVVLSDAAGRFLIRGLGEGRFSVEGPSGSHEVIGVAAGDRVWVGLEGFALEFEVRPLGDERVRSTARDQDALMPPMAATVVRIEAHPGDRVDAGDTLVVLEAMKMELPIRAPRPATIRAIHCSEGQLVQPGTVLVELDDDPMIR